MDTILPNSVLVHYYIENHLYYHLYNYIINIYGINNVDEVDTIIRSIIMSENMHGAGIVSGTGQYLTGKISSLLKSVIDKKIDKNHVDNNLRLGAAERKNHQNLIVHNMKKSKHKVNKTPVYYKKPQPVYYSKPQPVSAPIPTPIPTPSITI